MSKESDQKVKDAIAAIRKELSSEELDKISSNLKTIEYEFKDVLEDTQRFLGEAKDKKKGLQSKDVEIGKLQDEITELKADDSSAKIITERDDLKKKNEGLEEYKTSVLKSRRESFISRFDKIKDHVNFEKISKGLKVPEEKDGKRDWSKVTDDEIGINLSELQKAEDWGIFGDIKTTDGPNPQTRNAGDNKDPFKGKFKES